MTLVASVMLSLFLTIILIPVFSRLAVRLEVYDMPGPRKVHEQPVPRVGGLAMAIGAFVPIIFWVPLEDVTRAYLLGGVVLVAVGIIDDWRGLGYKTKFAGQILAALIAVFYGGVEITNLGSLLPEGMILADWASLLLTVLVLVGVTNAINLADGLDGLAGGISLLIFGCIGYLAYIEQDQNIAILAVSMMGACIGFLRFNTFPATLFMGDTGSQLLGFSAAFFSLALTQGNTALSPLLPIIILGFPLLDTLAVMAQRIQQGRSPFAADKNHFHHRLMRMGLFQTEAVFAIYVIQSLLLVFAYIFRFHSEWFLLLGYGFFCIVTVGTFTVADRTGWKLKRFDVIDRVIKGRLRRLRGKRYVIRTSFGALEVGVPLLLIFMGFLPDAIPDYFSVLAGLLVTGILLVFLLRRDWLKLALIYSTYLFIPVLVYLGDTTTVPWMAGAPARIFLMIHLLLLLMALLTLRFTHRTKGFRPTPMDFLVLLFTLVLMVLPDLRIAYGLMAMKMILLYFCYEIILGEVRESVGKVAVLTVGAFLVVMVRGLVG